MTATLNWNFDLGNDETITTTVQTAKFGDGYEARVSIGLNPVVRKWTLTSTRAISENIPLIEFLEARKGAEAFIWTDPDGFTRKYVCRTWTKSRAERGLTVVKCDFEQVFEP